MEPLLHEVEVAHVSKLGGGALTGSSQRETSKKFAGTKRTHKSSSNLGVELFKAKTGGPSADRDVGRGGPEASSQNAKADAAIKTHN